MYSPVVRDEKPGGIFKRRKAVCGFRQKMNVDSGFA